LNDPADALNHVPMVLNSDLIEHIDVTPIRDHADERANTARTESADEVVERIVDYRRRIYGPEGRPRPRQEPDVAGTDEVVDQSRIWFDVPWRTSKDKNPTQRQGRA